MQGELDVSSWLSPAPKPSALFDPQQPYTERQNRSRPTFGSAVANNKIGGAFKQLNGGEFDLNRGNLLCLPQTMATRHHDLSRHEEEKNKPEHFNQTDRAIA